MKKPLGLLLAGVMITGLAGCAGSPDSQELSQKTVNYGCGPGGEQALTVQYTFRGEEVLSARVTHLNQVIDMQRVTSGNADMVNNTFRGGGYTWVAGKFDRGNVGEVDGDMLTRDTPAGAAHGSTRGAGYGGAADASATAPGMVGTIVLRDCRVS